MKLTIGELVDRLCIVNARIWHLESDIRKGKEGELGLEEVGRRAIAIREHNAERTALKNELTRRLDPDGFLDTKVNHASGRSK